jgi:hypothetical protein
MPFGRLHEEAAGDSKLLALSDAAWRMWGMGLIYCQKNLTDGFIPAGAIFLWGVRAKRLHLVADELCAAQVPGKAALWSKAEGGYQVHDYLQWNDSKDEIVKMRADAKDRIARFRDRERQEREALEQRVRNAEQTGVTNGARNALRNAFENAHDVVRGTWYEEKEESDPVIAAAHVLELYREHWKAAYGYDCSLITKPLEDMQLGQQIAALGEGRVRAAVAAYFAADDPYVRKARHPLALFLRDPNKYLAKDAAPPAARPKGCRHEPPCADDATHTSRRMAEARQVPQ